MTRLPQVKNVGKCITENCDKEQYTRNRCLAHWLVVLRTERRKYAYKYLGDQCADCGIKNVKFEFDHINPDDVGFRIAVGLAYSIENLTAELDKCQLLCHECHQLKTFMDKMTHRRYRSNKY